MTAKLKTVSMNELYETVYRSKPPIIDGLLYPGAYLFVGAPKLGKSFLVAQLASRTVTKKPSAFESKHQNFSRLRR